MFKFSFIVYSIKQIRDVYKSCMIYIYIYIGSIQPHNDHHFTAETLPFTSVPEASTSDSLKSSFLKSRLCSNIRRVFSPLPQLATSEIILMPNAFRRCSTYLYIYIYQSVNRVCIEIARELCVALSIYIMQPRNRTNACVYIYI